VRDGEAWGPAADGAGAGGGRRRAARRAHGQTGNGVASAKPALPPALVAMGGSPRLDQQMKLLLAEMRLVFHTE
jgi:hypothetical protein